MAKKIRKFGLRKGRLGYIPKWRSLQTRKSPATIETRKYQAPSRRFYEYKTNLTGMLYIRSKRK